MLAFSQGLALFFLVFVFTLPVCIRPELEFSALQECYWSGNDHAVLMLQHKTIHAPAQNRRNGLSS